MLITVDRESADARSVLRVIRWHVGAGGYWMPQRQRKLRVRADEPMVVGFDLAAKPPRVTVRVGEEDGKTREVDLPTPGVRLVSKSPAAPATPATKARVVAARSERIDDPTAPSRAPGLVPMAGW